MSVATQLVWGHTERPWGYEVRVDYLDGETVHNHVLTWPAEPTPAEIDALVESTRMQLQERSDAEALAEVEAAALAEFEQAIS